MLGLMEKCWNCKKKMGIIVFKCKCEKVFCAKCRYPEVHKCDYDYKSEGRKKIKDDNPIVKGEKINRI